MTSIIRAEGLSKRYVIGHERRAAYSTLRDELAHGAKALARRVTRPFAGRQTNGGGTDYEEFWALRDVSFEVKEGDRLGIIGRNGAGKSTLLKILSRITEPTSGRVTIRGRVASLLEVGTGFHPELSGRENIFLNGAVLGMSRAEIARKFDEIVAFAEIEKFLDTPVKRYSSGMYVRLAFAVAAHLEPEIMIVDEVLAVGDVNFQKKCLGKMEEVAASGRTIVFVSHNTIAIQAICSTCAWIDGGCLQHFGRTAVVLPAYLRSGESTERLRSWSDPNLAPGNGEIRIARIAVTPVPEDSTGDITLDSAIDLAFEFWNLRDGAMLNLSLHIVNEAGVLVMCAAPVDDREWFGRRFRDGLFRSICRLPARLLNSGTYRVELLVVRDQSRIVYRDENAIFFEVKDVQETNSSWFGVWSGVVRPRVIWSTTEVTFAASKERPASCA